MFMLFHLTLLAFCSPTMAVFIKTFKKGDILNSFDIPGMQNRAMENKKWPGGVVQYVFSPGFLPHEIRQILGAMAEIEQKTCVRFKHGNQGSHVRIGPSDGCGSHVGYKGRPWGQELDLGPGCFERRTILHELMHTLGFNHEHTRFDRDDYVIIYTNNIEPSKMHNFDKDDFLDVTVIDSEYNYNTIMHYRAWAFAINPELPVLKAKRPFSGRMGGENELSNVDVDRINNYYECPISQSPTPESPNRSPIYSENLGPRNTPVVGAFCYRGSVFRPDSNDCLRYLECVNERYISRPCPPGTSFHADRGHCYFVNMAKCFLGSS